MNKSRVLIAHERCQAAEGIRSLLEPHCDVVGIVSNGDELRTSVRALDPDVVVVDTSRLEALTRGTDITRQVVGNQPGASRGTLRPGRKEQGSLTSRQREVLQLVARGCSAKEIAAALKISRRTAEFHKARLMEVLDVHSVAGLVQYAIHTGVVSI